MIFFKGRSTITNSTIYQSYTDLSNFDSVREMG